MKVSHNSRFGCAMMISSENVDLVKQESTVQRHGAFFLRKSRKG